MMITIVMWGVRQIGTIRQTCGNSTLRNGVKIIEITKYESGREHKNQDKTSH